MDKDRRGAKVGVLCWEVGQVPRGLVQLEALAGNSTNPASYQYPVRLHPVKGANAQTILVNPSQEVLQTMIHDARKLVSEGIKVITTSCGFNAIFQQQLATAVDVPVLSSSLLQVPLLQHACGLQSEICVITANAGALRPEHFSAVGIHSTRGLHIVGLENCPEWSRIFSQPESDVDLRIIEGEVLGSALAALTAHPGIRAFVMECTDLPPYSSMIRDTTGLPVLDFITMIDYLHASI
jgi:hypothetical protein